MDWRVFEMRKKMERPSQFTVRSYTGLILATGALFCAVAAAQSTSPATPTPLTSAYSGKGPSQETDFYFSVTGGPGEVSVTVRLSAKQYSTFARLEVTNAGGDTVATLNMDAASSTGTSQQVKSFSLAKKQTVRLKLTLDSNLEDYSLSVGGAVKGSGGSPTGGTSPNVKLSDNRPRPVAHSAATTSESTGTIGTAPAQPVRQAGGRTNNLQQNAITIACPRSVTVGILNVPNGWFDQTARKVAVTEISAGGRTVTCQYKDAVYDSSLIQSAPGGFECNVPYLGVETAECRRKLAIKTTN
jgi:hypothetical protein